MDSSPSALLHGITTIPTYIFLIPNNTVVRPSRSFQCAEFVVVSVRCDIQRSNDSLRFRFRPSENVSEDQSDMAQLGLSYRPGFRSGGSVVRFYSRAYTHTTASRSFKTAVPCPVSPGLHKRRADAMAHSIALQSRTLTYDIFTPTQCVESTNYTPLIQECSGSITTTQPFLHNLVL